MMRRAGGQWAQLRVRRPATPARDPRHPPIPGLKVPTRTPPRSKWLSGLGSLLLHLAVAIAVIANLRKSETAAEQKAAEEGKGPREVQLVYIPPPPKPVAKPQPQPEPPPPTRPPAAPLTPGPDKTPGSLAKVTPNPEQNPNAPPQAKRSEATAPETQVPPDDGGATKHDEQPVSAFAPLAKAAETPSIEAEAQRIFGRPLTRAGEESGVHDSRPWESPLDWSSNGCTVPKQDDSTAGDSMGVVQGRVFRENGRPLPGAHLQILGTGYYTYSDPTGAFRLVFDRSLVDKCRTQSVRVSAPGYSARDLILYVGPATSSDVVLHQH